MNPIKRVAVLGSGVMGGTIAAHLANAGLDVLLLDVVPREPTAEEKAAGLGLGDRAVRDRIAAGGRAALEKMKPAPLFLPENLARIAVGNLEDDLPRLADCDWVVEVVVENMAVKKALLGERVAPHLAAHAVLSTNTSGLSVNEMAEALPEGLRRRFLVTHFFNPPRYMRLVEIVSSRYTDPAVAEGMAEFLRRRLGKGIVYGKDTPNFVANRIGVFAICSAVRHMLDLDMTVEEVDAVAGPATARPRSAVFRTADLVGIDTLLHVADNSWQSLPHDEQREAFRLPEFFREMVARKQLGNKTKGGFFRKGKEEGAPALRLDVKTGEYVAGARPRFPSVEATKGVDDPAERLRKVLAGGDKAAQHAWRNLRDVLLYSFRRIPEIADDVVNVDAAMRWGFNWDLGPFEMLDAIGVPEFVRRAEADGVAIPEGLRKVERFYDASGGRPRYHCLATGTWRDVPRPAGQIDLGLLAKAGGVVDRNAGASVLDLGDGVFCLEFHTKMNAIGLDVLEMVHRALARAEREGQGLVVANQGPAFSAGANLMLLAVAIGERAFDDVSLTVAAFQKATMALKYAPVPVVAAPHGLALGGGCEVCLHADALNPLAETYMGLVEIGVGLLPAGGGTKEMALRAIRTAEQYDTDVSPFLFENFRTIAMAKVSGSADELRRLGFMRHGDAVTMSPDRLVQDARAKVLALATNYRPSRPAADLRAPGRSVAASLWTSLWNMRAGGFITEYEEKLGRTIAGVISGGDVPGGTPVTEQWFLDLEREAFLSLCGEPKTMERIQHMLKKGKPLRNERGAREIAMKAAYVVAAVRTPGTKARKGKLRDVRPDDLAAAAIRALLERAGLDPALVEDVILGCAFPEGEQGMNLGRVAALKAGLPVQVPGQTVNRFCASGLQTVASAAERILAGGADCIVAGGAESMSLVPMGGNKFSANPGLAASWPETYVSMGITAEIVADRYRVSREDQDAFAAESHRRAAAAQEAGLFAEEIVPVEAESVALVDGKLRRRPERVVADDGVRKDTTPAALARLKPAFKVGGTVTAGNASQMTDGAAAVLVASEAFVTRHGLAPLARFASFAVNGVAPEVMGIGPVVAIPAALARAGIAPGDVAHLELNEAFAAQALACVRELDLDPARVNPSGGAIALGHPLGCTGAKLTATLVHALRRSGARHGVVSMCVGGGMGAAAVFERA